MKTADSIIKNYIKSCEKIWEINYSNSVLNNIETAKLRKLFKILNNDLTLAQKVLSVLLEHECIETKIVASFACLRLNIYVDRAVNILEQISIMDNIGVFSSDAEMCLRIWRGELPEKHL